MSESDFEKLGVFYLGKEYDLQSKQVKPDLCLYDSKDLVTHAVCVGMTGSGKTGLCIGLIEEAAIDGIPVIAIDPKGDISNILLQFPNLQGSEFQPWVDPDQARRDGQTVEEFANQQAENWKKGLGEWGQDGARIRRMQDASEFCIYTPGSSAGIQISVLKTFSVPPDAVLADSDLLRERIASTSSSLLALLGIDADPLKSREHILLSNIFKSAWQNKQDLTLPEIIQLIQKPPVKQIGALDLDSFYPPKERFELAMKLNNLLASPGFDAWMQGEALDIGNILYTPSGKSKVSIFSIAHLDEAERMFFVSLLLNQFVSWMRAQSGTSSLRAILYMDEIFGYFPPVANPPSKTPLLTLMKQGRAYGVGVLLASQNPVDLDYKGLANAGTWFIGRLQTERDKMRVLDGLEGATSNSGSAFDRNSIDKMLSALGKRAFLMNNVHEDAPVVFMTRWTLSYLRGPLTREQIKLLKKTSFAKSPDESPSRANAAQHEDQNSATNVRQPTSQSGNTGGHRPVMPPGVPEFFLPVRQPRAGAQLVYRPMLLGFGNVRFTDTKSAIDSTLQYAVLVTGASDNLKSIEWSNSQPAKVWAEDVQHEPEKDAIYEGLPPGMSDPKSYAAWTKDFTTWLYNSKKVILWKGGTGEYSKPRESERDFRIRLTQSAREARDGAAAALKTKYAPKLASLQERLRRAEQIVEREQAQVRNQQMDSAISVGATVLGALMGRKSLSRTTVSRAGSAARSVGRTMKEQQDVQHAEETVGSVSAKLEELNVQFHSDMNALEAKFDPMQIPITEVPISPKKANIAIPLLGLAWAPVLRHPDGREIPAWIKGAGAS